MYSKEESKQYKIEFWNAFRASMSKTRTTTGARVNWLHYPSHIKFIFIRLDVDEFGARFCIDIQSKDAGIRAIVWEQLHELKKVMESEMGTTGVWIENASSPAVPSFNRIMWEDKTLNLFEVNDREKIFAFLSDRLVRFDAFYQEFKDILINLVA